MRFETCDAAHLSDPIIEPFMGDGAFNLVTFEWPGHSSSLNVPAICQQGEQDLVKNQPFDFPRSKAQGLLRVDTERRF
jgi:hypothetical protein